MTRYRIAVCDDEPSELGDIVQCVKRYFFYRKRFEKTRSLHRNDAE